MKQLILILLFPMLLFATNLRKKVGFEFFASPTAKVGAKFHTSKVHAINPSISFNLEFYYDYDEYYNNYEDEYLGISIDQQFYLPVANELDHYLFLNIGVTNLFDPYVPDFGTGYGLQYQFNKSFAIFGELGVHFSPYYESLGFNQSGIGLLFYIR